MHRWFWVFATLHSDEEPEYQYQSEAYICFLQDSIEEPDILGVEFPSRELESGRGSSVFSLGMLCFFERFFSRRSGGIAR